MCNQFKRDVAKIKPKQLVSLKQSASFLFVSFHSLIPKSIMKTYLECVFFTLLPDVILVPTVHMINI